MKITDEYKSKNYFSTSDLALTATIALYFPLESVDKANPQKVEFFFKKSPDLEKLVDDFWRGKLLVEPQAYFNRIKGIKARIYDR